MEKIASFTIDHLKLKSGLYVSRLDTFGAECFTTFDIRMTEPNAEPVMGTAAVHAIEHLGATYLRNHHEHKDKILYFGPMGCRTGFYLVMHTAVSSADILPLVRDMMHFICSYEGQIPGASAKDCGNFLDMNLPMAKYHAQKYLNEVLLSPTKERLEYPL